MTQTNRYFLFLFNICCKIIIIAFCQTFVRIISYYFATAWQKQASCDSIQKKTKANNKKQISLDLITNKDYHLSMKTLCKSLFLICLMLASFLPSFFAFSTFASEPQFLVIENQINLYQSATSQSEVVAVLPYQAVLSLVNPASPTNYDASSLPKNEAFEFYHVFYMQGETLLNGWVLQAFVMPVENESIRIKVVPNATIHGSIHDSIPLFLKENLNYTMHETLKLQGGSRVKIIGGYQAKSEYTEIEFEHENKNIVMYVKTNRIRPDGVSALTITALSVLLACVTIATYSFVYSYRKKK